MGAGGAVAIWLAAGCSGQVDVVAPRPTGITKEQCVALIAAVPDQVAGQGQRAVTPDDALAAAWGDPAIVLRCGVQRPALLRRDSACFAVNDVGWFAEHGGRPVTGRTAVEGDVVFTTIGRSAYVELTVPSDYEPAADALVDVAEAVARETSYPNPCQ